LKIKPNEIYTFVLLSGQELVGTVESVDDKYYHLLSPLTLGRDQRGGMGFTMPSQSGEPLGESSLQMSAVAIIKPTRADVMEAYKQSVDPSAIITPGPKQIITG